MNVRKIFSTCATLGLCFAMVGCSGGGSGSSTSTADDKTTDEQTTITVFAAASLTESLTKIANEFMAQNSNYKVVMNFDSSGTLKTQIQEGAEADIFISAGQKQMNQLDATKDESANPDKLDLIDSDSRFDILENKVVLAVPEGNPKGIKSFDQLAELLKAGDVKLAIGNSDVPVGQYTQKIFEYYNLNEDELAKASVLTYGTNVKEVTSQVSNAAVDAGIVYQTDATSAGLTSVDAATEEMAGRIVYPAALTKNTKNKEAAQKFFDFLKTDTASAAFKEVGFTPLS